jgi:hypothetical protein
MLGGAFCLAQPCKVETTLQPSHKRQNRATVMHCTDIAIKNLVKDAGSWSRRNADPETQLYVCRLIGALKRTEARRKRAMRKLASK